VVDFLYSSDKIRLQNEFTGAELRFFLGLERAGILEDFAVAVAREMLWKTIRSRPNMRGF